MLVGGGKCFAKGEGTRRSAGTDGPPEDDRIGNRLASWVDDAHLGAAHPEGEAGGDGKRALKDGCAVAPSAQRWVGDEADNHIVGLTEEPRAKRVPDKRVGNPGWCGAQIGRDRPAGRYRWLPTPAAVERELGAHLTHGVTLRVAQGVGKTDQR